MVSARSRATSTEAGSAPAASTTSMRDRPASPRVVAVAPSSGGANPAAVAIGITIVRPEDPGTGPSPARMPATVTVTGAPAPRRDTSPPTSRPSLAASRSVTSAWPGSRVAAPEPLTVARSRTRASRAGSMPRTRDGRGDRPRPAVAAREERPPLGRGRGDRDARHRVDGVERPCREPGLGEGRDPEVRTPDRRVDGALDRRVEPGVDGERRHEHRDADRDPERRQQAARGPGGEAAPRVGDETAHRCRCRAPPTGRLARGAR